MENPTDVFVDRRKVLDDMRSLMGSELSEWNRRRDDNLKVKLEAIEKYFNLSVNTRSDALHIAINRVQGDNSACTARCNHQVFEFYVLINGLKETNARIEERVRAWMVSDKKVVRDHEVWFKKNEASIIVNRKELDAKIDSLELTVETEIEKLGGRFTELENWKRLNWKQTLIWAAAAIIGITQLLNWIYIRFLK